MEQAQEHFDVAVLGAGICGLNAAYVAAGYLRPGQRLLIVDRQPAAGGMWLDAYDYVRLHQPHPLFTVGDLPWTWDRSPDHLATREEVVAHLQHCLDVIGSRTEVRTMFGHEYLGHEEIDGLVRLSLRGPDGEPRVLTADRFVKAVGFEIAVQQPLPLSSQEVVSTSPARLTRDLAGLAPGAPVWVVGSGKTAMDTVLQVLDLDPGRPVHIVTGTGTYFTSRERALPTGSRRWWAGYRVNRVMVELVRRYDGTNHDAARSWFVDTIGTSPWSDARHNIFGVLAAEESARIRAGLGEVVRDHLVDIVDEPQGPVMVLRSGGRHSIARGSAVVSCLGHFAAKDRPYEPYVSASGKVASVNSSSSTFGFSSFSGYYLAHLMMRDLLRVAPLVEVDWDAVQRRAQAEATAILSSALIHNLSVAYELMGPSPFNSCGLDFDRWYPVHRRLAGQLDFARHHRRDREHAARSLQVARERHGFRCGPLAETRPATRPA